MDDRVDGRQGAGRVERWFRALGALAVLAAFAVWHELLALLARPRTYVVSPPVDVAPDVVEHELGWRDYLRAFDAHNGPDGDADRPVAAGDVWRGLAAWVDSGFLRGYTLGDETYVCPNCPQLVRVHQAGHAPAFGASFEPLGTARRADGGLPDEPLSTLDVMLPGRFPHTFLRLRDSRGLAPAYLSWLEAGRIRRVRG